MTDRLVIPPETALNALREGYTLRMEGEAIVAWKELPGLSPRMLECLQFIHAATEETGVAPSYEEIRIALGLGNRGRIHRLIDQLSDRGYVVRYPYRQRSLRITQDAEALL